MIITKTPMRLPLGGGGTDLPEFYEKYGGFWVSASVNKYVYLAIHSRFEANISLHYSKIEEANSLETIQHEIFRVALAMFGVKKHVEISSLADLPSRSGMGSSGAFTVGLINALSVYTKNPIVDLAELAYRLEREYLNRATGKQDQYTATLGGCRCYRADKYGKVTYGPPMDVEALEPHLTLFYTGLLRDADPMIRKVAKDEDSLATIKIIGEESWEALNEKKWDRFGELLHEHWLIKRGMVEEMSNSAINNAYRWAILCGASGGKLVGAGGGGFLLFYTPRPDHKNNLQIKMAELGLPEVPFRFEPEGSKVIEI